MTLHLLIDECLSPNLVELAIHAGYVESTCLRVLFEAALKVLSTLPDLINQVLEVTEEVSGDIVVTVYELPAAVG